MELIVFAVVALALGVWLLRRQLNIAHTQARALERELEQARAELNLLHARWNNVTRNIREGVVLVDAERRIVFLNDAAESLLNTRNAVGRQFGEVAWSLQLEPLLREVIGRRFDSLSQTVVNGDRTFQVDVHACASDSGGALIVFSEVTELQRLGRMRRDFFANISHELRTPVTTLRMLADTIAQELPGHLANVAALLAKLRGQVDVLSQLNDEMMDLALIESGQMPIKLVETCVSDLIAPPLELLRPQAERKQIVLDVQVPADLRVLADREGIHKVVSNLLHNAIKFTQPRGNIAIRARRVEDNVEIRVADTGSGIPARDLPRIFERFYKVDRSRAQNDKRGTGLGLAIAKHIIEGHGGKIWAESVEGKGSAFYFTLPAIE